MEVISNIVSLGIAVYSTYTEYQLVGQRPLCKQVIRSTLSGVQEGSEWPEGQGSSLEWLVSTVLADIRKEGYQPKRLCLCLHYSQLERGELWVSESALYMPATLQKRLSCICYVLEHLQALYYADPSYMAVEITEDVGGRVRTRHICTDNTVITAGHESLETAVGWLEDRYREAGKVGILVCSSVPIRTKLYFSCGKSALSYGAARYAQIATNCPIELRYILKGVTLPPSP